MEKATNLGKIKEIAQKHFDAYDISVEVRDALTMPDDPETILHEVRCRISHPYFRTLFGADTTDAEVALYKALNDPVEFEKVKTKLLHAVKTTLSEVEDPMDIFSVILSQHRMSFLKETKQFLSPSDYNRVLHRFIIELAPTGYSPSEFAQLKADVLELFEEPFVRRSCMSDIDQKYYDALPDVVTVYHGVNEETENYNISDVFFWTTEIVNLVPTEDCGPHESDDGIVYEAKIRKEDIYTYQKADDTCLLNPDKLFDISHHTNFPLDDIELDDKDTVRR